MIQPTTDQILLKAIQELQESINRIDRDLGNDRSENERLAMTVANNTEQVNHFGKRLETIEKKIQDKMSDVIAPLLESNDDLTRAIEDKKMVASKMAQVKTRKWWKWFW